MRTGTGFTCKILGLFYLLPVKSAACSTIPPVFIRSGTRQCRVGLTGLNAVLVKMQAGPRPSLQNNVVRTVVTRKKKKRFAEIETFPNVFDRRAILGNREWWREFFTQDSSPILELGCGKGDLTLELGRRLPGRNFIGIDRRGDRIWKGAKAAIEEGLANVAFLKTRVEDLSDYFAPGSIGEIWLPYPDPLPKRRQIKHRLLAPSFLEIYRLLLIPGGLVRLKTDELNLLQYAREGVHRLHGVIHAMSLDLYAGQVTDPQLQISTDFEKRHIRAGKKIRYLCFGFVSPSGAESSRNRGISF